MEFPVAFVVLGELILVAVCLIISLTCFGRLLLWHFCKYPRKLTKTRRVQVSVCMLLYMCGEAGAGAACLPYVLYLLALWRPGTEVLYDAHRLFATGALQTVALLLLPLAVFFLALERCVLVLWPLAGVWGRRVAGLAALGAMAVVLGVGVPCHILPSLPTRPRTPCRAFGCLGPLSAGQVYTVLRQCTAVLNVAVGCLLFRLVRSKEAVVGVVLDSNRLVVLTLALNIALDSLPHLVSFLLYTLLDVNLTRYLGPYSLVLTAVTSAVLALTYRRSMGPYLRRHKPATCFATGGTVIVTT